MKINKEIIKFPKIVPNNERNIKYKNFPLNLIVKKQNENHKNSLLKKENNFDKEKEKENLTCYFQFKIASLYKNLGFKIYDKKEHEFFCIKKSKSLRYVNFCTHFVKNILL